MAADDKFDVFGLMTVARLRQSRLLQEQLQAKERRALPGLEYAGATAGAGFGAMIRDYLVKNGQMVDPEIEKADAISHAVTNARTAMQSDPKLLASTDSGDLFAQKFREGELLIDQLNASGYSEEADQVRVGLIGLQDMRDKSAAQRASTRSANATAQNAENKDKLGTLTTIQRIDGTGEADVPLDAMVHPSGNATYKDPRTGQAVVLEPGQFRTAKLTGGQDALVTDKTFERNTQNKLQGAYSSLSQLTNLREMLIKNPTAFSKANEAAGFFNRLGAEARAILPAGAGADVQAKVNSYFSNAGMTDGALKAMVTNLGYAIAGSREDGRFTDPDIANAIISIGGGPGIDMPTRVTIMDGFTSEMIKSTDFMMTLPGNGRIKDSEAYTVAFRKVVGLYNDSKSRYSPPPTKGSTNAFNQEESQALFDDAQRFLDEEAIRIQGRLTGKP